MSMSPGATTQPDTSFTRALPGSIDLATAAILPAFTPTSNDPSTWLRSSMMRPPFRTRSKLEPTPGAVMNSLPGMAGQSRQTCARRAALCECAPSGELHDPLFVDALLGGKHDPEAVH